MATDCNFKHKF